MTGRERVLAALSPGGTDETPAVICYEGIYIRDHWDQLTGCPWWYRFSPDPDHQLAWRRDAMAVTPQDWFSLPSCPSLAERQAQVVEERGDEVFLVDHRTGREQRLARPPIGGWDNQRISRPARDVQPPKSAEEVDAAVPAVEAFDAERLAAEGRADLAQALLREFGSERLPIASVLSPLWRCAGLWGFEGMMTLVAERPDLIRRACDRFLADSITKVQLGAALGAEAFWIEECFTDLISPAAFEALNLPYLRRLIEAIRSLGLKSVYYYCGNPADRWPVILSAQMDALALEESKKAFRIDIDDAAGHVAGRCALLGNLDAVGVLQNGDDAKLRMEITRQIEAGRRNAGRFIMSLGSPVTPQTPATRVRRYCELVREPGA